MNEAYKVVEVVSRLPLTIESMCVYNDYLLVGTRQGHLLMYQLTQRKFSNEYRYEVTLQKSNKSFAKKPIMQIAAVPELHILICLSDNIISIHELTNSSFSLIRTLVRTKGATLFELDVQKQTSDTGMSTVKVRLCVVVKRKLQLYEWDQNDFHEMLSDLHIPDIPRMLCWCKDAIFVGLKTEYNIVELSGKLKELFPIDKQPEPVIVKLDGGERFGLSKEQQTYFVDSDGNPTQRHSVKWSEIPVSLVHDPPYLIGVLPSSIEVRTIEPQLLLQRIDLPRARLIAKGRKRELFVASTNDAWCLVAIPFKDQIPQLVKKKQYDLAVKLLNMTDESDASKKQGMQEIRTLYAFDLFCKKNFREAMNHFFSLSTDPSQVIGLFPHLLPDNYQKDLKYPDEPPQLQGEELIEGLHELASYLVQIRHSLMGDLQGAQKSPSGLEKANKTIRSTKQLLQIVDTTLLKCYLMTNEVLVASLLRVPDNYCHLQESEKALKQHKKYSELIILYQVKGKHKEALNLLVKHAKRPDSPLSGSQRIVQYLQHLGADHLDLIFTYAEWVMKEFPKEGIKIFTDDVPEIENLPRESVLEFFKSKAPDLVLPYLEHVVYNWKDTTPVFHNHLLCKYQERIRQLRKDYLDALPEGQLPVAAGKEPGKLGELRIKLLQFLQNSDYYRLDTLHSILLNDSLFEEAAIVLGKMESHEEAIHIYVHILHDKQKAEDYCIHNYDPNKPRSKDVFYHLLRMYLSTPDNTDIGLLPEVGFLPPPSQPDLNAALKLLKQHADKIDPLKSLVLLPSHIQVPEIHSYLSSMMHRTLLKQHGSQILKNLLSAECLMVQGKRIKYQSHKVVIDQQSICRVCHKKIGKSAFARFPDEVLVHFSCKNQYSEAGQFEKRT